MTGNNRTESKNTAVKVIPPDTYILYPDSSSPLGFYFAQTQ